MKKLLLAACLSGCCVTMSGCFYYPLMDNVVSSTESQSEEPEGLACPQNPVTLREGQTMEGQLFELDVNSAGLYKTYEGETPGDEDWRFLVINVTIKSRFEHSASLYLNVDNFSLTWPALEGYAVSPDIDAYITDQLADYNNEIRLFKNSKRTGNLIFVVPRESDDFRLIYDQFMLPFHVKDKEDPYYSSEYGHYPNNTPYYESPDFDIFDFFGGYYDDYGYGDYYDGYDSYDDYDQYDGYGDTYDDYGSYGDQYDDYGSSGDSDNSGEQNDNSDAYNGSGNQSDNDGNDSGYDDPYNDYSSSGENREEDGIHHDEDQIHNDYRQNSRSNYWKRHYNSDCV